MDDLIERVVRVRRYIEEYEDAPSWGGPTMYPAPPSMDDLRAILAALDRPAPVEMEEVTDRARAVLAEQSGWHEPLIPLVKDGVALCISTMTAVRTMLVFAKAEHPAQSTIEGVGIPRGIQCPQIVMSHGKVDVGIIHWEDRTGIILHPRDHVIPIYQPGALSGDYWPSKDDVVIWIDDPAGAQVIIDELLPLTAKNGEKITNPPPPTEEEN